MQQLLVIIFPIDNNEAYESGFIEIKRYGDYIEIQQTNKEISSDDSNEFVPCVEIKISNQLKSKK